MIAEVNGAGRLLLGYVRPAEGFQFVVEGPVAQGGWHVDLLSQVRDILLRPRPVEEGGIQAERVKGVAAICGVVDSAGGAASRTSFRRCGGRLNRIALETPQEQTDVRDVVSSAAGRYRARVQRVGDGLERSAQQFEALGVAQVRCAQILRAQVVEVLRGGEQLEELDHSRRPGADVARQLFQDRGRALAAPVGDGVRDVGAVADGAGADREERPCREQIADVGHDPIGTGLDEPVLEEVFDVLLDIEYLVLDRAEQGAQGVALVRVPYAVDGGQQVVEAFPG